VDQGGGPMIKSVAFRVSALAGGVIGQVDRWLARDAARNAAVGIAESRARQFEAIRVLRALDSEPIFAEPAAGARERSPNSGLPVRPPLGKPGRGHRPRARGGAAPGGRS
jgi:hypothetical protein